MRCTPLGGILLLLIISSSNGFAAIFFAIAAVVYKYLFIYVLDQPASSDTGGAFLPIAIGHVFVGLYVQEGSLRH